MKNKAAAKQTDKKTVLPFQIKKQPDEVTCGPTCLQSVYRYWGEKISFGAVSKSVAMLPGGGTLAVYLGSDALRRGYRATLYTYNLKMFDPTWFSEEKVDLSEKLQAQLRFKKGDKMRLATQGYLDYIKLGGLIRMEDLKGSLLRRYLSKGTPILTGLSSTALYRTAREYGVNSEYDDIRGQPGGHFVVLHGYDIKNRKVMVADPYGGLDGDHHYEADLDRVVNAILLGIVTYDGNFLILEPKIKK